MTTTITEYDPYAPEVRENPYPYYQWLREAHPVYHNQRLDIWAISRYADVAEQARNPEVFSSAQGIGVDKAPVPMMIAMDPPDHSRLRSLVSKAFTPKTIQQMEPRIGEIVDGLIDRIIDQGQFDLVQDLAYPLPVIAISELLGVEPEKRDDFKRWSDVVVDLTALGRDRADLQKYLQVWQEFKSYFADMIERRRQEPRDDLISALVQAQEERDALTTNEILNFCLLLLVAGNETTTNLISNGARAIFDPAHEDARLKLRQQPELIHSMVEEVLRYDGSIQGTFRTTTRDFALHGVTIPANSKVVLLWGSANHDPEQFPDPDRFDIERTPNRHLGFGLGIHSCLGAPLARLECRVATAALLRRMRNIRPAPDGTPERGANPFFRGFKHFPLAFDRP